MSAPMFDFAFGRARGQLNWNIVADVYGQREDFMYCRLFPHLEPQRSYLDR